MYVNGLFFCQGFELIGIQKEQELIKVMNLK